MLTSAATRLTRSPEAPPRRAVLLAIFVVCLIVYNANCRLIGAGDSRSARLLPFAILTRGTVVFDSYGPPPPDAHWFPLLPVASPERFRPIRIRRRRSIGSVPRLQRLFPGTAAGRLPVARGHERVRTFDSRRRRRSSRQPGQGTSRLRALLSLSRPSSSSGSPVSDSSFSTERWIGAGAGRTGRGS
jgi:hypothetical protein